MKTLRAIVVGIDFAAGTEGVLRQAARLAKRTGANVTVVHVVDEHVVKDVEEALSSYTEGAGDLIRGDAERTWREVAERTRTGSFAFEVRVDHPVRGLLRRVEELGADLLLLGTGGHHVDREGAGTVARACVRGARVPVLLARGEDGAPFRRVLACVDFSETARRALEYAAALAQAEGAELLALHVFDAPWHKLHYRTPTSGATPERQAAFREVLGRRLEEFVRVSLAGAEVPPRTLLVDAAGPRSAIARTSREQSADLIVLGGHSRVDLRDLLLGSTAEKLLEQVECSMLVVPPA